MHWVANLAGVEVFCDTFFKGDQFVTCHHVSSLRGSGCAVISRMCSAAAWPNFISTNSRYSASVKKSINARSRKLNTSALVNVFVGNGLVSNECWLYPDHDSGRSDGFA